MFQLFPKTRKEWLRAIIFPFQAYMPVAFIVWQILEVIWPGGKYRFGELSTYHDFKSAVLQGYAICFWVLLIIATFQLSARQRTAAFLNVGWALVGALLGFFILVRDAVSS
jgi:hypothetical protein